MKPMNLLFIMSDQHSKEKYAAYGNPHIYTPNLDALCGRGVRFEHAYCTNPICVPSRASIATGDYGFRNSYWDNSHPYCGLQDSWGTRLTQQGFRVTTIGKLHYRDSSPATGFPDQRIPLHLKDGIGDITACIRDRDVRRPNQREVLLNAGAGESDYLRYDAKVASLAAEFLTREANQTGGKPFCLYVGFATPHFPLKAPERLLKLYEPYDKLPFPIQWGERDRPMHPAIDRLRQIACTNEPCITEAVVRKAVAAYYALVTYMDEQVGIVLDALQASGLTDTTRIIYTSDHGDTMGDHCVFFKNTMYEGSVSVPLVLAGPDIPAGKTVSDNVSLVDIFPTVLEGVGANFVQKDKKLPGRSLWNYAFGYQDDDRVVFSESHTFAYKRGVFMIRCRQYKLIDYLGLRPQLFDLNEDPQEQNDLALDPAYQGIIEALRKKLYEICDPEEVDARAHREQAALLERFGGEEHILSNRGDYYFSYSPVPEGT